MVKTEMPKAPKSKPQIRLNESDAKFLKGKTVGDKINLMVTAEVIEVRKPSSYDSEKTNYYELEIKDTTEAGNKGKRVVDE